MKTISRLVYAPFLFYLAASAHGEAAAGAQATPAVHSATVPAGNTEPVLTPLVMQIEHPPVPVKGGDGRYHLLYELDLANFSGERVTASQLRVLDAGKGTSVAQLAATQLATRLVVRDLKAQPGQFGASQYGILYLHVRFDQLRDIPQALAHQLNMTWNGQSATATAARIEVPRPTTLLLDAPLRGARYIAGDGCCDSKRHIRATLSLNGGAYDAQRFAIDWEQLDANGRIYVGDAKNPKSYMIYGKPAYAVADAKVIAAVDNSANSPIGSLPNVAVDQADGNHVILDLGGGCYAMYAHFAPHTLQVHEGQYVKRGDVLGMVGTSGNSSEPHLHFQVMDGPSSMLSNGLPYLVRQFSATQRGVSTAAFDKATTDGQPIETAALPGPAQHQQELPLDLWITDLP
jgi:murein DD-endopeptidase MepM/ murein hydrolase activator NlpD